MQDWRRPIVLYCKEVHYITEMAYCPEKESNGLDVSGVKVLLSNTGSFELAWRDQLS